MKLLTALDQLAGKTIKQAISLKDGPGTAFICDDDSCLVMDLSYGTYDGDSAYMYVLDDLSDIDKSDQVLIGLLTQDELSEIIASEKASRAKQLHDQEIAELERLKAKFEPEAK